MNLFLLRHSIASQHAASGRDSDRALTAEGNAVLTDGRFDQAAALLAMPALIVSSPYRRARETAKLVANRLGYQGALLQSDGFTPDASPRQLWEEVRELAAATEAASILVVAHEPLLSSACSWLLGSAKIEVEFSPATLVMIEFSGELKAESKGKLLQVAHAR